MKTSVQINSEDFREMLCKLYSVSFMTFCQVFYGAEAMNENLDGYGLGSARYEYLKGKWDTFRTNKIAAVLDLDLTNMNRVFAYLAG